MNYLRVIAIFAYTQFRRSLRDPMTLAVLFAIPLLLILVFGTLLRDTSSISLRVAVINHSQEQFAADFEQSLTDIEIFNVAAEELTVEQAKAQMRNGDLDGIVELPETFGQPVNGVPSGTVITYRDESDAMTNDIVSSVMRSVIEGSNQQLTETRLPLSIEQRSVSVNQATGIDFVFATFASLSLMMVGVFGVATVIPYDKKGGYLRRLRVTPLRPSQFMLGTMLNYAIIGLTVIAAMTILAVVVYGLQMHGQWLDYVVFVLLSLLMMLGFGLAVGGIAKNTTQSDILGQIIFLGSMVLGGVWFPLALLPEFLQAVAQYLPLTVISNGIRSISAEGLSLTSLNEELLVIGAWAVVGYVVGIKLFRWE